MNIDTSISNDTHEEFEPVYLEFEEYDTSDVIVTSGLKLNIRKTDDDTMTFGKDNF